MLHWYSLLYENQFDPMHTDLNVCDGLTNNDTVGLLMYSIYTVHFHVYEYTSNDPIHAVILAVIYMYMYVHAVLKCFQACNSQHTSIMTRIFKQIEDFKSLPITVMRFAYTLCLKNDTDVAYCNFNAHQPIFVIFARYVAERVC